MKRVKKSIRWENRQKNGKINPIPTIIGLNHNTLFPSDVIALYKDDVWEQQMDEADSEEEAQQE